MTRDIARDRLGGLKLPQIIIPICLVIVFNYFHLLVLYISLVLLRKYWEAFGRKGRRSWDFSLKI
jgi:hypothetical protein